MAGEKVLRARVGIHDTYRGVFLNRGVFVKAPPEFFQAYPSDFETPPQGYEKLGVRVRTIDRWHPKTGILMAPEPKVETPAPQPEVVAAAPDVVAAPAPAVPPADPVEDAPESKKDQPKPAAKKPSSRRMVVRR